MRVFAMLEANRQLEEKREADFMRGLINVIMVPHAKQEYIDDVFRFWKNKSENAIPEFRKEQSTVDENGVRFLPMEQATKVMLAQMAVFKKVNSGRRL